MIDPATVHERLADEAADLQVGFIALDVVLGDGAHPDPAGELAPLIRRLLAERPADRPLEIVVLVVGTRHDPQDLGRQIEALTGAGARVVRDVGAVVSLAADQALPGWESHPEVTVPLSAIETPIVINVGLASFAASLAEQGGEVVRVEWRPPAGGDPRLAGILRRMKGGRG
jgi:FdrA protein